MTRILAILVSVLVSSTFRVEAWGPIRQAIRFGATRLKMKTGENFDEYRALLEKSFVQSYEDDIDIGRFDGTLSLRAEVGASLITIEEVDDDWTLEAMAACGDDCEECLIPDDLKVLLDWEKDIDVMAFLGIQRAEPLRATRSINVDWD
jgi:hypothetical protein